MKNEVLGMFFIVAKSQLKDLTLEKNLYNSSLFL